MIFLDRMRRGDDPHLDWKVRLFVLGAVLALVGIGTKSSAVVGLATAVLLLGLGWRFLPGGDGEGEAGENDESPPCR
jgi:hypothetical protein